MSGIVPIPSSRVSTSLINSLLTNNIETNETGFLQLETEVSTGKSFQLLSQDPANGLLGLQLQEQINQKTQVQTNLTTDLSYMNETDSVLTTVANQLNSVQSTVEAAVNATSTPAQQQAAAQQVQSALQQLLGVANTQYEGRYLFAGSDSTVQPFETVGNYVQYNGNTGSLQSFSDINQLFTANIDGNAAFGAISAPIEGSNLSPNVTADTPLADLNGGKGVEPGSIEISDGTNSSTVDLSSAKTVGDVVALIQANAPPGRQVYVSVTPTGLDVHLDSAGGGNLSISEVGGDTTAADLGILNTSGVGSGQITGSNLNPQVTLDTSLKDVLGTAASATINSPGYNNDIQITALSNGAALNNVAVSFNEDPSILPGSETVTYDTSNPSAPTLVFNINPAGATANNLVAALNNNPTVGKIFQASLVTGDSTSAYAAGSALVDPTATAVTSGGSGINLDQTDGLQITSAGTTYNVDLSSAQTVQDVINDINQSGANVEASINSQGTGLQVVSKLSGADFSIGENGGTTATELGLRTFTTSTQLADLNHGNGVHTTADGSPDFTIQRADGTSFSVSVTGADTVGDVINLINNNTDNQGANKITAQLDTTGNGIELVSNDTTSTAASFQVIETNSSTAAQDLGLVPSGQTTSNAAVTVGGTQVIAGSDVNPQEVTGVFNSLSRLYTALQDNDTVEVSRDLTALKNSLSTLGLAQSELGSREQAVQTQQTAISNNLTTLNSSFSTATDTDMTKVITQLTSQQTQYEAALQVTALMSHLSLLNFL